MTYPPDSSPAETFAIFADRFRLGALHLADCGDWVLSLRPGQLTLGAMVLSLRTGARDLAAITPDQARDMGRGFALAETLARTRLGAVRVNLLCLMMQDPVVHFHILPRHDRPVTRHGLTWTDADWPGPPVMRPLTTPDTVLAALREDLRP